MNYKAHYNSSCGGREGSKKGFKMLREAKFQAFPKAFFGQKNNLPRQVQLFYTTACDHIQFNVKRQNSSQEPPASFKAPHEDLKDMDVLCTFKMKIESKNLDHGYIKDQ